MSAPAQPLDFNLIRKTLINTVQYVSGLQQVVVLQPESQDWPRPAKPYIGLHITTPAAKSGDDSKQNVPDEFGAPTTVWNSGGVRKMSVRFVAYGKTHEDAYNYLTAVQTGLDLEDVQEQLRRSGIAVWIIGNVADVSQLLNTGFEGRASMDCDFGVAANMQSDLGSMDSGTITGTVKTGTSDIPTTQEV